MQLWLYLFIAMKALTQVPDNCATDPRKDCQDWAETWAEAPEAAEARYEEIAHQIAKEASWRKSLDNGKHTDMSIARHALDLLFIAGAESKFSLLIDNGTCNRKNLSNKDKARVKNLGGCDSGRAFTMWQMHPDLIGDAVQGVEGNDLVKDRAHSISIAWVLRRIRPKAWSTWRAAKGLSSYWELRHPLKGILLDDQSM